MSAIKLPYRCRTISLQQAPICPADLCLAHHHGTGSSVKVKGRRRSRCQHWWRKLPLIWVVLAEYLCLVSVGVCIAALVTSCLCPYRLHLEIGATNGQGWKSGKLVRHSTRCVALNGRSLSVACVVACDNIDQTEGQPRLNRLSCLSWISEAQDPSRSPTALSSWHCILQSTCERLRWPRW